MPTVPTGVQFRPEGPGEASAVREVGVRAFGAHGAVVGDLVDALRTSDAWLDGRSYVAEIDGQVIGHILFTRSLLDAPRRLVDVLVLSPVGVVPEYQGRGVGSALVRYGLAQLSARPEPIVFLEGDPAYYVRFGFLPGNSLGFGRPSLRIPEAAFQVIRLPSYEDWMTGTLVYARTFWDLDCVGLRDPKA